ncbi:MAG: chaperone modulatory protein CbpM [Alphaproteobacteria bacterium]|jgi:chaperone modulatory protein CbpM
MVDITLYIAIDELCENQSFNKEVILEVVEYGIAKPSSGTNLSEWVFDLESAHWIKKAIKLNQQLLLDWVAISMVIDLMKEKERLVQENIRLKVRLSRLL